jgi:hypothetical protein
MAPATQQLPRQLTRTFGGVMPFCTIIMTCSSSTVCRRAHVVQGQQRVRGADAARAARHASMPGSTHPVELQRPRRVVGAGISSRLLAILVARACARTHQQRAAAAACAQA